MTCNKLLKSTGTAAQEGGGVTVLGGVLELWGCGTEGRGQWAQWGWFRVGAGGLIGHFQPGWFCDSMVPSQY